MRCFESKVNFDWIGSPDFPAYDTARGKLEYSNYNRRAGMKEITVWHNPQCSKSRQTLELLREKGCEPHVVFYLEDPPSTMELGKLLKILGCRPRELMRIKEPLYQELSLATVDNRAKLIQAMAENPSLIERPIVICGDRAAIGRPPENVLPLLESKPPDSG